MAKLGETFSPEQVKLMTDLRETLSKETSGAARLVGFLFIIGESYELFASPVFFPIEVAVPVNDLLHQWKIQLIKVHENGG